MDVLTYSGRQVRPKAVRTELDPQAKESLTRARWREGPAAYVVDNRDLEILRHFDGVVDRGTKPKTVELSKLLLRYDAVPLIRGTYGDPGQLLVSVRSLLTNAAKEKERNIYVIGTDGDLFKRLWIAAHAGKKSEGTTASLARRVPCEEVLNLLGHTKVPPELEQRFVGSSSAAQLIRRLIVRAASTSDDVLILGDTGTGKEVVARAIHTYSGRRPFVHVSCAAFAADQFDGALFGQEDGGSFKPGFWQQAQEGMLFLDEIGGLRLDHQARIMRTLTERRISFGARRDIAVPARVVAASNRDLFALMQAGQFREDLYYRLRAFSIRIPPLRARSEDVPLLAQAFWREITWDENATLSPAVLASLESYHWPGNARELKAILSAVHAYFGGSDIRVEHVRAVLQEMGQMPVSGPLADGHGTERTIACLRHLRHVDEVIRACRVTVRPLLEEKRVGAATVAATHDTLHYRLHELELLCMQPLLFNSEGTFKAVYELKGALAYFHGLLETDGLAALHYWKKDVAGQMDAALTAVVREEARLVEGV